jgi:hypothetical protein
MKGNYKLSATVVGSFLLALAFSGGLQSCKHDPFFTDGTDPGDTTGVVVIPTNPCDPATVYFATQVLPILQSNCALSGCHDEASRQDGVILTSYQRVMQTADVRPGNLSGSDLYEVITETRADKRMPPPPRQMLTSAQINIIRDWILQGAKNLTCDVNAGICNTDNRSYAQHVRPIIQNFCQGCHSGAAPSAGIDLSTYAGVSAVIPNNRLVGAIEHLPGFTAMPLGGAKMSACNINQIKSWIATGALNN